MSSAKSRLIDICRRNIEHGRNGTVDQAEGVVTVPAANYTDPDRYQRELDQVFRRVPLVMGLSREIPTPGDYKALQAVDTPVLVIRQDDGSAQAFVNACSHRGAQVVADGTGSGRRFTCPYHAWNYDREGTLVGILDREEFGEFDTSCRGLVPLPTHEAAGIVWANLRPRPELSFSDFMAGYDEVLEFLGLEHVHVVGTQQVAGPNWKVAYDGYMDFYHLPVLHKDTFGADFPNKASYDAWGPHQQVSAPNEWLAKFEDCTVDEWPDDQVAHGILTIFPHISVARFEAGGDLMFMISQLFPGPQVGQSVTNQIFALAHEPSDQTQAAVAEQMTFLEHVVRNEDYATGLALQRGLATGALADVLFGRNEAGGQFFHRFLDELLATADDGLTELFARHTAH